MPSYDQRDYSFTNTTIRMDGSEFDSVVLAWNLMYDIYAKNTLTVDGLLINVDGSFFSPIYAGGFYTSEMNMSNVRIVSSTLASSFLTAIRFDTLSMSNIGVEETTLFAPSLIAALYFNQYSLQNFTMREFSATGSTQISVVQLNAFPYATASLSDWDISSSVLGKHNMVYFNTILAGSLKVNGFNFSSTTLGYGASIIRTGVVEDFKISNSAFTQIAKYEESDKTSSIINIESIKLVDNGNYSIQNTTLDNSSITFFEMNTLDSAGIEGKLLQMESIYFMNIYSLHQLDLILIENLETTSDFGIVLSKIEASNITFASTGSLFSLHQQTVTPLLIKDCYFHDLVGVQIFIESFNLVNKELLTSVIMANITATSINSGTSSFILNNEGGRLEISNSTFSSMENIERGAVITGGYQNSQTTIYNSTFVNNTSVYGGVAYVHSGSVVKFYE